ncbi:zinc ribbon domain-containing protein [Hydrogenoanaerobacterium sp.]|uniref:zinc ribbon domain-containing protein n=1 Tax=Hydrogenoanaerobacterium sp. TaxID=2953763 RepID=UPI0028A11B42|nr:zinc ribbon domain-containing protein [Hydrogenoanaerobacterium sp.]
MDTFDEFLGKAKNLVDLAGKKTGEAVELAKLKMSRMQLNGEIQKTYEKLGAFVYKFHKSGEDNQELIDICVGEIDSLLVQLDAIASKINEIRSSVKCPQCGALNDEESIYCAKCGAKMAMEPATEPIYADAPAEEPAAETQTEE